jgi:hypothetical protein
MAFQIFQIRGINSLRRVAGHGGTAQRGFQLPLSLLTLLLIYIAKPNGKPDHQPNANYKHQQPI